MDLAFLGLVLLLSAGAGLVLLIWLNRHQDARWYPYVSLIIAIFLMIRGIQVRGFYGMLLLIVAIAGIAMTGWRMWKGRMR